MPKTTLLNVTVADAYLALLADRGVDYFFANAGTDFAPIVEALAKAQNLETRIPEPITCPHENTAMHMAIGYYLVTGKPQVVMVHVNVGTANGMNGFLNASRGNIPMLFTAGRTPTNEEGLAGHRSLDIHWTQEMFDQASMVREAAKWDYELRNGKQTETIVDRALAVAKSEPTGPVYLSLPREVLSEQLDEFTYDSPGRQQAAAPPYPNAAATDQTAALLADAEHPLIITNWAGRNPGVWGPLGDLAERYAIPVVQYRNRYMSLPTDHPMNLGYDLDPLLGQADVILVVDVAVPWLPATDKVRDDAKVIHMGADPLHSYVPLRGHPCDIALACATDIGLTVLNEAMSAHEGRVRANIDKRRRALAEMWRKQRDGWAARLEQVKDNKPLHPLWITHCINQIKGDDTIVVKESALASTHIDITQPGTLLNAGAASGLGHGLGVALGAKLAAQGPAGHRHPRRRLLHVRQSHRQPLRRRGAEAPHPQRHLQQPEVAGRAPGHRGPHPRGLRGQERPPAHHHARQRGQVREGGGGGRRLRPAGGGSGRPDAGPGTGPQGGGGGEAPGRDQRDLLGVAACAPDNVGGTNTGRGDRPVAPTCLVRQSSVSRSLSQRHPFPVGAGFKPARARSPAHRS